MNLRKTLFAVTIVISIFLFCYGVIVLSNTGTYKSQAQKSEVKPFMPVPINQIEERGEASEDSLQELPRNIKKSVPKEPVNILLIGLDQEETRSDVMILLNMNPETGKINMISIPRDTRIKVRGRYEKMNALYAIGKEKLLVKAMEQLSGLKIKYYITLNFKGFRKIIDTLDGVEIEVPFNMNYDDPDQNLHIHLSKGKQVLNGAKAEQFVRYRKGNRKNEGYEDGDIGRIKMQHEFIKELLNQKLKLKYITKADDIFVILKKYMKTNIEISDIRLYIMDLKKISQEKITMHTTPGDSIYIDNLWYFVIDKKATKKIIEKEFSKQFFVKDRLKYYFRSIGKLYYNYGQTLNVYL